MSFRSSLSDESGLLLGGSLTIENACRIREDLLRAFSQCDAVVVGFTGDVVVDSSFMQLLCSASATATLQKKGFSVDWSSAQEARQSMGNAGYLGKELSYGGAADIGKPAEGGQDG